MTLPENIQFTSDPAGALQNFLAKKEYSKLVVLTDTNTRTYCYPLIAKGLPPHELVDVPAGEEHKVLDTCVTIWQAMTQLQLDRHALMIVLGGGVLGDMGGFCAATYKRGIDFILVPTTLLAQVDASIGGKLGIDFNHFKNHIGVFQLPELTLLHSGFLNTLPEPELRSGYAEVIKHILTSDKAMWETIRQRPLHQQDWDVLIAHSVAFKAKVTTKDPRETGLRKILNAGHTIGHALESYFIGIQQRVLHGEAIAVGLVAEGYIAMKKGLLDKADLKEISDYIYQVYGRIRFTEEQAAEIAQLVIQDKKNKGNKILCVLQHGIGDARWDNEISLNEVTEALLFYRSQT